MKRGKVAEVASKSLLPRPCVCERVIFGCDHVVAGLQREMPVTRRISFLSRTLGFVSVGRLLSWPLSIVDFPSSETSGKSPRSLR